MMHDYDYGCLARASPVLPRVAPPSRSGHLWEASCFTSGPLARSGQSSRRGGARRSRKKEKNVHKPLPSMLKAVFEILKFFAEVVAQVSWMMRASARRISGVSMLQSARDRPCSPIPFSVTLVLRLWRVCTITPLLCPFLANRHCTRCLAFRPSPLHFLVAPRLVSFFLLFVVLYTSHFRTINPLSA